MGLISAVVTACLALLVRDTCHVVTWLVGPRFAAASTIAFASRVDQSYSGNSWVVPRPPVAWLLVEVTLPRLE